MQDGRIACSRCGRGFARDRVEKHEQICSNLANIEFASPGAKKLSNETALYGVKGAVGFVKKTE